MRPDGPRDLVAGPDEGPAPPFPLRLDGKVIRGFGRGSGEVSWTFIFLLLIFVGGICGRLFLARCKESVLSGERLFLSPIPSRREGLRAVFGTLRAHARGGLSHDSGLYQRPTQPRPRPRGWGLAVCLYFTPTHAGCYTPLSPASTRPPCFAVVQGMCCIARIRG